MESRKIQRTGGSTYTVSLPKNWIEGRIEEGEEVFLFQKGDDIQISFQETRKEEKTATLETSSDFEVTKRRLVALYLNGVDRIIVRNNQGTELQEYIRNNLIGMEIVKVDADKMELRNLFRHSEIPAENGLRRMTSIIRSMMRDLAENQDTGDIAEREELLDRYYLLELRQLQMSLSDPEFRDEIGLESAIQAMEYRVIAKSMERIGDHLVTISRCKDKTLKEVSEMKQIFDKLSRAIFEADSDKIEECISSVDQVEIREARSEELRRSLRRIKRLILDISEASINYSISRD
ncbi:MAG: AbrB/MazE/SpoVT family DNA-binding domain-containing protein [Candidatus Nanohaloarchaea archaeon]